jgi:ubiquinone/menaquinone biosynthesis C-methylase UbiE
MSLKKRLFAATYDRMSAATEEAGLRARRRELLVQAHGRVLEIGGGTGANLPFYGDAVTSLTVTEPEEPMVRRLRRHVASQDRPVEVVRAPAEHLPFDDESFDCGVSALVLCAVESQPDALAELRRVIKPGGQLLFIEHVRSREDGLARWQDRLNWLNQFVVNCDCNRPTLDRIQAAGFSIASVTHGELPKAPRFVRPLIVGAAIRRVASGGEAQSTGESLAE